MGISLGNGITYGSGIVNGIGIGSSGISGKSSDPSAISGVALWLDPQSGVALSGSNVESWRDRSANALLVNKVSDASRFVYDAAGINGRPAMDVTTTRFMAATSPIIQSLSAMTAFVVFRQKTKSHTDGASILARTNIFSIGRFDLASGQMLYGGSGGQLSNETCLIGKYVSSANAGAIGTSNLNHAYFTDDCYVMAMTCSSSGSKLYRGNSEMIMSLASTFTTSSDLTPAGQGITDQSFVISGIRTAAASYSGLNNCYVGDIIIYNRVLRDSERAQVTGYLENKYAIQSVKPTDWFFFAGQSNAQADQALSTSPDYDANFTNDSAGSFICVNGAYWDFLKLSTSDSGSATKFGAEIPCSRDFIAGGGTRAMVTKHAVGGSSLAVSWKGTPTYGTEYQTLLTQAAACSANAAGAGFQLIPRAFFWLQGEQDATDATNAANYQANLTALVNDLKTRYGNDFNFIAAQISVNGSGAHRATVRAGTVAALAALDNCYVIDTDDMVLADTVHFDTASIIDIGNAYSQSYLTQSNVTAVP